MKNTQYVIFDEMGALYGYTDSIEKAKEFARNMRDGSDIRVFIRELSNSI